MQRNCLREKGEHIEGVGYFEQDIAIFDQYILFCMGSDLAYVSPTEIRSKLFQCPKVIVKLAEWISAGYPHYQCDCEEEVREAIWEAIQKLKVEDYGV